MALYESRLGRSFTLLLLALLVSGGAVAWGQTKKDDEDANKSKGRLPPYFKDVIDSAQKDKIYKLQSDYTEKIAPLQEQIKKLVAERDAAIEQVLTPEQKEKLKKIKEEAAGKRKAEGLGPAKTDAPKTDAKPAEAKKDK